MVMDLLKGVLHLDPQYLVGSVREVKCARLGCGTRLSRLHTSPPISFGLSKEQPFSNKGPQAKK
jgi:hypothetical protein